MGLLKGRFSSLRGIRIQVKTKKDFAKVNRWILACLILHNIVTFCNDPWDLDGEDPDDVAIRVARAARNNQSVTCSVQGIQLRDRVKTDILEAFY